MNAPPLLSVVIPLRDEAGNIAPLLREICSTLSVYPRVGDGFEIVCVNDGSVDGTEAEVAAFRESNPAIALKIIRHGRSQGMSVAIRNAVRRARADWIFTIDGDGQNDPADIPRLCDLAWVSPAGDENRGGKVLVAGIRAHRRDTLPKRLASRVANAVRRMILRDDCPDTGCAMKLFRRDGYLDMPFFNGLHRFMPALFRHYGHQVWFAPVNDRPRLRGISKSDFAGRAVRGAFDILGVTWLMWRTPSPPDEGEET